MMVILMIMMTKNIQIALVLSKNVQIFGSFTWWKKGQQIRAWVNPPPPLSGQCPKENVFLALMSSLNWHICLVKAENVWVQKRAVSLFVGLGFFAKYSGQSILHKVFWSQSHVWPGQYIGYTRTPDTNSNATHCIEFYSGVFIQERVWGYFDHKITIVSKSDFKVE